MARYRWRIVRIAGVSILAFAAAVQAPLSASGGTPTDLLPRLSPVHDSLEDHDLVRNPRTGQVLLRFTAAIANSGAGTLDIVGHRGAASPQTIDPNNDEMPAFQRIHRSDGSTYDVPAGTLSYHPVHHHFHFNGASSYRLIDSHGIVVRQSPKVAFCLADILLLDPTPPRRLTGNPPFESCAHDAYATDLEMGISAGMADVYDKALFGQAFDVTDLMTRPAETYLLEQTTNPQGVIVEANPAPMTDSVSVTIGLGVPVKIGQSRPGV